MQRKKKGSVLTIEIEKYRGLQVAIVQGKIVASGRTTSEAIERACVRFPGINMRDIELFAVPKTFATLYATEHV
ncbi:hypothetical protein HY478_02930 [Candidatus Uhrbacteria bacterium]|nr:hypothetical protein [Candidatus Uhrbacteria bacterium]